MEMVDQTAELLDSPFATRLSLAMAGCEWMSRLNAQPEASRRLIPPGRMRSSADQRVAIAARDGRRVSTL